MKSNKLKLEKQYIPQNINIRYPSEEDIDKMSYKVVHGHLKRYVKGTRYNSEGLDGMMMMLKCIKKLNKQ